jgi:hypothetical protein
MPETVATAAPLYYASYPVDQLNELVASYRYHPALRENVLAELHERATFEDEARAVTDDEWTRGFLAAAAEWARPWPTDPR